MEQPTWKPGSADVVRYLLRPEGTSVSAEARLVYLALFGYMNGTFTCWPEVETLATGCGLSERTVQRRLDELEVAGLLTRGYKKGQTTVYHLYAPWSPLINDGGVRQSPPTDGHPRQTVTLPPSDSHPTPVSVTPEVSKRRKSLKKEEIPTLSPQGENQPAKARVTLPRKTRSPDQAPAFSKDALLLATTLYDALKAKDALPVVKGNYFTKQAAIAEKTLLPARPLADWLACLEWALADEFWGPQLTDLGALGQKVWSQYARRNERVRKKGVVMGEVSQSFDDWFRPPQT